jgi:Dolichyl-phosphate-mannose-protein mannosyltransferase
MLDENHSNQRNLSYSLRTVFSHLFFPEKDPLYIYLIVGVFTLIGLFLRLLLINKPVEYDEAYTFLYFASRSFQHILADYSAPNNHIFHTILVGLAYRLFGGEPWVLRFPAFIAGILMVPVMYITARRFFSRQQALAASALIALGHWFIMYSVNGRGYTILILLALLQANVAGILVTRHYSKSALIAFALTGALGFYTIPIFLYPMAGISLWVSATYLVAKEPWRDRIHRLALFLGACIGSGLLTLVLYSPVIIFGTGFSSIFNNEIVGSLNWSTFLENLDPRITKAWRKWMVRIEPTTQDLLSGGFLLSLFLYRKISNQKLPLQVFLAIAVVILLLLQRVTPLPRMWLYLEAFYLLFAGAGLVWLADVLVRQIAGPMRTEGILSFAILLAAIGACAGILTSSEQQIVMRRGPLPEQYAAEYIVEHLKPEDIIIATGPVTIRTAYHASIDGVPFDRFYQRDHPLKIQNGLVLLRKNSKFNTPQKVLDFFKLGSALDVSSAELVFEYGKVQIYSIPARE